MHSYLLSPSDITFKTLFTSISWFSSVLGSTWLGKRTSHSSESLSMSSKYNWEVAISSLEKPLGHSKTPFTISELIASKFCEEKSPKKNRKSNNLQKFGRKENLFKKVFSHVFCSPKVAKTRAEGIVQVLLEETPGDRHSPWNCFLLCMEVPGPES
ncbi:hypothetical protein JTE90_008332 [Oedothorax gibbosus]|uniref:Uncharacterized protein n=1 Tax=Oedothorax gibbosus TaxID=931172 RepID=A0AAV6U1I8_9ARAC|nr:hypothetical protein JTE90_008332 [Oedothorax gibbosus]